ncbi:MAG TPA: hypothetical protein VF109_06385 [Mycobacteriales bacterium]
MVEVLVDGRTVAYRLARHPRSGRPATDQLHRFLYVPASDFWRRFLGGRCSRVVLATEDSGVEQPAEDRAGQG